MENEEKELTSLEAEESKGVESGKEPERKYSDEDVDRILDKKFAEWQKKQQKAVDEAKRLAEMNAQQKAEYERDQLQRKLEELESAQARHDMIKVARSMLAEKGVTPPEELLSTLVSTDADKTKQTVETFAALFAKAVEDAVREKLKSPAPKASGHPAISKDDILKIKDREDRQKAIRENLSLFETKG